MRRILPGLRFAVQVVVLRLSYGLARTRRRRTLPDVDWVVGPYEVASLVYDIGCALPNSLSVILAKHRFYDLPYGWAPGPLGRMPGAARRRDLFLGPWQLGRLAASMSAPRAS
jgi:hypothetical protein